VEHLYKKTGFTQTVKPLFDGPPCTNDTALHTYMNNVAVKQAIHVDTSIEWVLCNENLNYQILVNDVTEYIQHAMNQVRHRISRIIF